jgi:hypothetical protein
LLLVAVGLLESLGITHTLKGGGGLRSGEGSNGLTRLTNVLSCTAKGARASRFSLGATHVRAPTSPHVSLQRHYGALPKLLLGRGSGLARGGSGLSEVARLSWLRRCGVCPWGGGLAVCTL